MARQNVNSSPYFVSAPVDFLFIGGLSILCYLVFRIGFPGMTDAVTLPASVALMWVVNWPHFWASSHRLYARREHLEQYPVTATLVPALVIVGVVASFAAPNTLAPALIKLFLLWSPYHFSGQSFGITMVYARRAGVRLDRWERLALAGFIFGTFLYPTLRHETSPTGGSFYGVAYPGLAVPEWLGTIAMGWMITCGVLLVGFAMKRLEKRKARIPAIVFLPAASQFVWFIPGSSEPAYYIFVPFFHSLQYLLIAWAVHLGTRRSESRAGTFRVGGETFRWAAINLAGGVLLFWGLPHIASLFGMPLAFATGVVIAGVQIHHFFVDGVIWKLRSRHVAEPLMASWREIIAPRRSVRRAA